MSTRDTVVAFLAVFFLFVTLAPAQVQQNIKYDVPVDYYLTPTEYPCLVETIHVSGTVQVHYVFVLNPTSNRGGATVHYTPETTAAGLSSGVQYRYSGPGTTTVHGDFDFSIPVETTVQNIDHFVGPGPYPDLYFRYVTHTTYDPATGVVKAQITKDDVICR